MVFRPKYFLRTIPQSPNPIKAPLKSTLSLHNNIGRNRESTTYRRAFLLSVVETSCESSTPAPPVVRTVAAVETIVVVETVETIVVVETVKAVAVVETVEAVAVVETVETVEVVSAR